MAFDLGIPTVLHESTARRPDWVEGVPILLENGEEWHFPRPIMQFRLSLDGGPPTPKPTSLDTNRRFSEAFWIKQSSLRDSMIRGAGLPLGEAVPLIGPLAVDLLKRNYDLTDDQALDLVLFGADAANLEMWDQIIRVVLGIAPKADAAG